MAESYAERRRAADEIVERANAHGVQADLEMMGASAARRESMPFVALQLPNGRTSHRFLLSPWDFDNVLASDFENFSVLGDYEAIWNKATGVIEIGVESESANAWQSPALNNRLSRIPGAELLDEMGQPIPTERIPPENLDMDEFAVALSWRLRVSHDQTQLQISSSSPVFSALFKNNISLTLEGLDVSTGNEALFQTLSIGNAFLFDLDLVHGIPLQFSRRRIQSLRRSSASKEQPLEFPRNRYPQQALEFYQYGRAASGLPLLEYLAYYQCIECFFPVFAKREVMGLVKNKLTHPAFDPHDDQALASLIEVAASEGRGAVTEREQLRATVRGCMDRQMVVDQLNYPSNGDHFTSRKQRIAGVSRIAVDADGEDIRDQIADRIYAIRCRIVHAKQGASRAFEDALLPTGPEASALGPDIELIQLVARSVILSQAERA